MYSPLLGTYNGGLLLLMNASFPDSRLNHLISFRSSRFERCPDNHCSQLKSYKNAANRQMEGDEEVFSASVPTSEHADYADAIDDRAVCDSGPDQCTSLAALHDSVITLHRHDVLCGRGGRGSVVSSHPGNQHYRALVQMHKLMYVAAPKQEKGRFAQIIVNAIHQLNPPGRFLQQDPTSKQWYSITDKQAMDKTRQALREGAPRVRQSLMGSVITESEAKVSELAPQETTPQGTRPHGGEEIQNVISQDSASEVPSGTSPCSQAPWRI